jgi:nucleoside-diphosphate-sugar epimerase
MKICIIGCSGFLGHTFSEYLANEGHTVIGVDVLASQFSHQNFNSRILDVYREPVEVPPNTDAVFYLAQSPNYRSFPDGAENLFGVNVLGAIKTAKTAREQGVRLFCFASSGNVYGPSFQPLCETDPVQRGDAYALSKVMAEEALDLLKGDMGVVSVRLFGIFGPGQTTMLPVKMLRAIANGKAIYLKPSPIDEKDEGGLKISFSYSLDVAYCLKRLAEISLEDTSLPPRVNIAGPEAISIRRFAESIGRNLGKKPHFQISKNSRKFDLIADISLLRSLINPSFMPFEEACASTYGTKV